MTFSKRREHFDGKTRRHSFDIFFSSSIRARSRFSPPPLIALGNPKLKNRKPGQDRSDRCGCVCARAYVCVAAREPVGEVSPFARAAVTYGEKLASALAIVLSSEFPENGFPLGTGGRKAAHRLCKTI